MTSTEVVTVTAVATAVFTGGATWTAIYIGVTRPRSRERNSAIEAELERQRIRDEALDGIPAQPGMNGAVPPLVVRVAAVEAGLHENTQVVKALGQWQKDANGTTKRIEQAVHELSGMVREIVATELTTKTAKLIAADSLATVSHAQHEELLAGQSANKEEILNAIGHDS